MFWLDDEDGDLVNAARATIIGVQPIEPPEGEGTKTHAVVAYFSAEEAAWLFSGSEQACIEFRNNLRPRLKQADLSKPDVAYVGSAPLG